MTATEATIGEFILVPIFTNIEGKASGDSFEIGDERILIYSSIGVQNSIF